MRVPVLIACDSAENPALISVDAYWSEFDGKKWYDAEIQVQYLLKVSGTSLPIQEQRMGTYERDSRCNWGPFMSRLYDNEFLLLDERSMDYRPRRLRIHRCRAPSELSRRPPLECPKWQSWDAMVDDTLKITFDDQPDVATSLTAWGSFGEFFPDLRLFYDGRGGRFEWQVLVDADRVRPSYENSDDGYFMFYQDQNCDSNSLLC